MKALMLACLLWGGTEIGLGSKIALGQTEDAIASVILIVPDAARDRLIDGLKRFAEANSFAVRLSPLRRDGRHYFMELWRADVNITATNPFEDPKEFNIFIYRTGTTLFPPAHIDGIIQKIKQSADIEGIVIVQMKSDK